MSAKEKRKTTTDLDETHVVVGEPPEACCCLCEDMSTAHQ